MHEIFSVIEALEEFKSFIDEGMAQAKTTIGQIEAAYNTHNVDNVKSMAHYLKGSMVSLGFRELARLLQVIHYIILYTDTPDEIIQLLKEPVSDLKGAYDRTYEELYTPSGELKPMVIHLMVEKSPLDESDG